MTSMRVDWEPFIESLNEAAVLWDRGLARLSRLRDVDEEVDVAPRWVVPITETEAEKLMRAVAFLARRLSAAAESVVYGTAASRLEPAGVDPAAQADALSLTALHAAAMRHAADLAGAASTRSNAA
jgi:hypothetical protein